MAQGRIDYILKRVRTRAWILGSVFFSILPLFTCYELAVLAFIANNVGYRLFTEQLVADVSRALRRRHRRWHRHKVL